MANSIRTTLIIAVVLALCVQAHAADTVRKGGWDLEASAGLGYDSNVYRAPGSSYRDLSVAGSPLIRPEVKSGYFVPLEFDATFESGVSSGNRFVFDYGFNGKFYVDSDNKNANNTFQKLRVGMERVLASRGKVEDTFYIGPFIAVKDKTYYDRDTGESKKSIVSNADISDTYSYNSAGLEAKFKQRTGNTDYKLWATYEKRDYASAGPLSEYDQTRYTAGGKVQFEIGSPGQLSLHYEYEVQDFDKRHARDADATLSAANPLLTYTIHDAGVTLRSRFSDSLVTYLDYSRIIRKDNHVGYNDYATDRFKVRALYDDHEAWKARAALEYWMRKYDNAFAFENPAAEDKEFKVTKLDLKLERVASDAQSWWVELEHDIWDSTDDRYAYTKSQAVLGATRTF